MPILWTEKEHDAARVQDMHLSIIAGAVADLLTEAYELSGGVKANTIQRAYIRKQADRLVTAQRPTAMTRAKTAADRALSETVWEAVERLRVETVQPLDMWPLRKLADAVCRLGTDPIFAAADGTLDRWGQKS